MRFVMLSHVSYVQEMIVLCGKGTSRLVYALLLIRQIFDKCGTFLALLWSNLVGVHPFLKEIGMYLTRGEVRFDWLAPTGGGSWSRLSKYALRGLSEMQKTG